jgi:hypothetical protein
MEALSVIFIMGIMAIILFLPMDESDAATPSQQQMKSAPKVVEATEDATEYPDGTVISVRKVRQWH